MTRSTRSTHMIVDPIACDGHGMCAELLPEHIGLDPWGYPIVDRGPIPSDHLGDARRTVALCPRLALRLEDRLVPVANAEAA